MFDLDTQDRPATRRDPPFTVDYSPIAELRAANHDDPHVLTAIHFSTAGASAPGRITVRARPLGKRDAEIWHSPQRVCRGREQDIGFSRNDDVLFGYLRVEERAYPNVEAAAFHAYRRIYAFAQASDYAYPLRIWNWLPNINRADTELERYRLFCLGRYRALTALHRVRLPAASAIGTHRGEFLIYFLAARAPGAQVENPRQVSAFRYPPRYSPKSPSFSRAVVKFWDDIAHLYISGTASIVGHETRHAGTLAQLDESLRNLDSLIRHADDRHGLGIRNAAELSLLKVYLRDPEDTGIVRQRLAEALGARTALLLLEGDICRADLRLEIEGLYTGNRAG